MATNFPTSLDTSTEQPSPSSSDELDDAGVLHDVVHSNASGALIALETKLGLTDSNAVKGGLLAGLAASSSSWLAVGSNGQVLTADSAESAGVKWATAATGGILSEVDQNSVAAQESTTSTSFTDLTTVGPTVTMTTGTKAMVFISGDIDPSTSSGFYLTMGIDVSGATTEGASDAKAMYHFPRNAATGHRGTAAVYFDSLTAGSNTFTAKYKVNSGTGYFFRRNMIVMDLGS